MQKRKETLQEKDYYQTRKNKIHYFMIGQEYISYIVMVVNTQEVVLIQ